MPDDAYAPRPEHKFSFGLWTVGNPGRDPFGEPVRPRLSPVELVALLGEVGAWGVNLHDNDLVPIDASAAERDRIVRRVPARRARDHGIVVPMVTTTLFTAAAFKDGAFTANDPAVRALSVQKAMGAMDLGAELGARIFVMWGGREGTETDGCRRPDAAVQRFREALNFLCEYSIANGYDYRFALEAKPNEPRSDIYFATTGAYLGFIPTLDHPELVGVNPEVAHEHMAGLNMTHAVAQAWEAGKLFHIDLNDQVIGRYDQDFRFGAANPKAAFWLVKFLEDVGYGGPRHFDAHAYRTEGHRGRQGLRARLHAHLPHPEGEGRAVERRPRRARPPRRPRGGHPGRAGVRRVQPGRRGGAEGPPLRPGRAGGPGAGLRAARPVDDGDPARRAVEPMEGGRQS